MKVMQILGYVLQYLSEAAVLIFGPTHDHYPATGMIPFSGDPYIQSVWLD